ncbi:peptidase M48 [Rhodobacteraceae bacterium 63075]|nr:peptidase M48 [Rhodobacteraceae bacterium 63075]
MSFIRKGFLAVCLLVIAGCAPMEVPQAPEGAAQPPAQLSERRAAQQFVDVVETVEPVVERECRRRTPRLNCDFRIVIDDRPNQPVNAYQTLDRNGRPIIAFTLAMIGDVRNEDELAFVMSHEAAHHVAGHIERQRQNAATGALVFAGLAALTGADAQTLENAYEVGAVVGARTYSKDFELEADRLGTIIAARAGYNPLRGALFFERIPDPGDRFLGTHPPNAQRLEVVRSTMRAM